MSSSWKILIAFLSGLLLGGSGAGFGLHCYMKQRAVASSSPDHILDRLSDQLSLSADQKEKVSALLKKEAPKMDALRQNMETQSHKLWLKFETDLRPILDQEQAKKLDQMEKRWNQHKGWKVGMSGIATFKDPAQTDGPK